ncbi:MAG TPA: NAD-dependent deacylase [Vicinamibacteria bacterium]|nr:NAD-dependent deacylase [Vicinamibacteria bacterium]
MDGPADRARTLLREARRAVAFTGAGVSTASGIPDFRSPGGIWTRYRPVSFDEFLASDEGRRRYWRYKRETFAAFAGARPNAAHHALAGLEAEGRLLAVVTQNIDGLHQEAGSRQVVELHGTNREVACLGCGRSEPAGPVMSRADIPTCDACGGWLKPATISFGQNLRPEVLEEAFRLARACDLMLVLGSSLLVYPAAAVPEAALERGAALVVVNQEPTPLDEAAAAVLHGRVEELLPPLVGWEGDG